MSGENIDMEALHGGGDGQAYKEDGNFKKDQ